MHDRHLRLADRSSPQEHPDRVLLTLGMARSEAHAPDHKPPSGQSAAENEASLAASLPTVPMGFATLPTGVPTELIGAVQLQMQLDRPNQRALLWLGMVVNPVLMVGNPVLMVLNPVLMILDPIWNRVLHVLGP